MKLFYTLDKTLLGETGCLSNLYYLLAAQASSFLIHRPFLHTFNQETFGKLPLTVQYLCDINIYQNIFKNFSFKIAPQKIQFQNSSSKNCSLKKYIFKIAFLKKINLISSTYSSSESSDSSEEEKSRNYH